MCRKRRINQLDFKTGKIIKTFDSLREASETNNVEIVSISVALRKRDGLMPLKRIRFEYAAEDTPKNSNVAKKVRQRDYYTNEVIAVYKSMTEAAFDNFTSTSTIKNAIDKHKGYMHIRKLKFEYVN